MLKVKEIVDATKGRLLNGEDVLIENLTISTNDVSKNCLFIPLKGEKTDGHKYILNGLKNECKGFLLNKEYEKAVEIVEECKKEYPSAIIIEVGDTLKALMDIGKYIRLKNAKVPVIAVTGSVGKTSTREMIYSVLNEKYDVLKTIKNYNSNIGVSLMLYMYNNEEIMLLEVGMDGAGQLDEISKIIKPDVSVITNIGTAHIGNLGSQENIYKAKLEILNGMNGGKIVVNGDDKFLVNTNGENVLKVYLEKAQNIVLNEETTEFDYIYNDKKEHFVINAPGKYQVYNALIAIEIGKLFNMDIADIKNGISKYKNFEKRMQKYNGLNNNILIDDSYNASLQSMKYGLEIVNNYKEKNKIVVLGDMLELGEYSSAIHKELGEEIMKYNFDKIYLYGEEMKYAYEVLKNNTNVYYYEKKEKIIDDLKKIKNSYIYFKASNGMKFYEIINEIKY